MNSGETTDLKAAAATVLVAEDDPMYRRILERSLRNWGYKVIAVDNGRRALQEVDAGDAPELLVLDWMMPDIDGIEVCRRIRALRKRVYPYILLLTAKNAKQDLIVGLDAGADDYLTKPFHADELLARLRAGTRILNLQRDLIRAQEQLQYQATHDVLTGIWNRRAIMDFLFEELERARRHHHPLGLMMIDLDHFKLINDRYGHAAGDVVLRAVANQLQQSVRPYDRVGRYGGEEFMVILSNMNVEEVHRRAEKLRAAVEQNVIQCDGERILITMSIGATATIPDRPFERSRLLRLADIALYEAKEQGRNRTQTYSYR